MSTNNKEIPDSNKWYTLEGVKLKSKNLKEIQAEVITLRMEERAKRSPEQQLALLDSRPGESKKERARLLKQIEERDNPKPKEKKENAPKDKGNPGTNKKRRQRKSKKQRQRKSKKHE